MKNVQIETLKTEIKVLHATKKGMEKDLAHDLKIISQTQHNITQNAKGKKNALELTALLKIVGHHVVSCDKIRASIAEIEAEIKTKETEIKEIAAAEKKAHRWPVHTAALKAALAVTNKLAEKLEG